MSDKPLPGTKAAIALGCRCRRLRGSWEYDWSFCDMHAPPTPTGPGICEHGERARTCAECAERRATNDAFLEDMRGLRYRAENDFGADL